MTKTKQLHNLSRLCTAIFGALAERREPHEANRKSATKGWLPLASLLIATSISASAQEVTTEKEKKVELETILVTAQKRSESLQDVPISIQTVTGETIQEAGIQRLDDLSSIIPNVNINEGFAGETISVRGFGSGVNPSFEQAVSTFIDGVYFGRAKQSLASFLDIDRVEVLRGPQSTFFGNNAIAGALNVSTRRPTGEDEGSLVVSFAPDDEDLNTTFAYGGMLTDTLGARVALKYRTLDGYLKLWDGGMTPEKDTLVGRISLVWNPNDNLEVFLKAELGDEDTTGSTAQLHDCPSPLALQGPAPIGGGLCDIALEVTGLSELNFDDVIETGGLNGGDPTQAAPGGVPPQNINSVLAQEGGEFRNLKTDNYNLTLDYDLNDYTLTSITGLTSYDSVRQFDVDRTPIASISTNRLEEFSQFSQEFRVVSPGGEFFDWLAGVYYQSSSVDFDYQTYTLLPPPDAVPFQGGLLGLVQGDFEEENDTWATFASGTWNFSETFSVTAGLRYSEVDKEANNKLDLFITPDNDAVPLLTNSIPSLGSQFIAHTITGEVNEEKLTGSMNAKWNVNDRTMLYVSYSEGFKAGGFDNLLRVPESANGKFTFATEEVEAIEFGTKMDWGHTRINLAAFRSEFTNLQQSIFNPAAVAFQISNVGAAISQGIEMDFKWAATENLTITATAALLDAYYETFEGASCSRQETVAGLTSCSLTGEALPFAADWNAVLNFDHRVYFSSDLEFRSQLTFSYIDDYRTGTENDPRFMQEGFETVDLRFSLVDVEAGWTVALWGKNLTDNLTVGNSTNAAVRSLGPILQTTNRPLSWGFGFSYNF
jgi:iron complex outermembrane receptor protein